MAETTTNENGRVKTWWKGLKSEFKKIVWPDKESVTKQTVAVVLITVILGLVIRFIDLGLQELIGLVIK